MLTSNLRPLPQGALAVNYDRLAAPDVQNASLGSNSVLMLLRLLRLCGAKAVLLAGADGYKSGTPPMPTACCTPTLGAELRSTPPWQVPSKPAGWM